MLLNRSHNSKTSLRVFLETAILFFFFILSLSQAAYSANEFEVVNDLWVNKNTGLGMTAPLARLHIYGAGTGTGFPLRIADTTPTDRLAVLDNGNVGIGLTNPAAKLDVSGQVKITGGLPGLNKILTSDANGLATWESPVGGWIDGGASIYLNTVTDNVGIGTTAPLAKLHIIGAGTGTGFALRVANTSGADRLVVLDNGNVGIGITKPDFLLQVGTTPAVPALVVTASGNVGIRTTNPTHLLEIRGGTSIQQTFYVDANCNVGIGVTAPSLPIEVNLGNLGGLSEAGLFWSQQAAAVNNGAYFTFSANRATGGKTDIAGVGTRIIDITNTSPQGVLVFLTANTVVVERMRIDNNGNVGIGLTSPLALLDIIGAGTSSGFALRVADTTATDRLVVLDNGNVGIGDTAPVALLQAGASPGPGLLVIAEGNVGMGTTNPKAKLEIIPSNSSTGFYLNYTAGYLLMKSPNGTCFTCSPNTSGVWTCGSVTCP